MKKRNTYKKFLFLILLTLLFVTPTAGALAAQTTHAAESSSKITGGKWVKKNSKYRYRQKNKKYLKSGFYQIGNYWYYFDKNGYVSTGWFTVNNSRYYGTKSTVKGKQGRLYTGWKTIKGNAYYFSKSTKKGTHGKVLTGWQTLSKKTYYFNKEGILQTGWKKINGKYFYFLPKGKNGTKGKMVTGWYTINKKKYYFRTTGAKGVKGARYKSEWITIDDKQYYFNSNGSLNSNTMTQSQFIDTIGKLASLDMKKTGILASVTTAQAILESGYGTSTLAMEAHNLFGMKATLSGNTWKSAWNGKTFKVSTKEYLNGKWYTIADTFRSYNTYAESLADHSAYLSYAMNGSKLRYDGVVGNKSYKKTIKIIKKGGYATDPEYVTKICNIIKTYKLTKYDK